MTRTLRSLSVTVFALTTGCNVSIPEGRFKCDTNNDCPGSWVCVESLCRSDGAGGGSGDGGDGGSQNGGNDGGSSQQDGGDDFDAGIDTMSCDAFTTFYRDSDGDSLGAADESVAACSVASGFVTNADDCNDMCTACTQPDAAEICDGFDNECDGKVDDGALEFSTRVSFDTMQNSQWVEVVETDDGPVLFSAGNESSGLALKGQRVNAEGAAIGAPVSVAAPSLGIFAAAHLNGKIVVAWFEGTAIKATVLKASDLTTLVAAKVIVQGGGTAGSLDSPGLDVVVSSSASGGRVLFSYVQAKTVKVHAFRLSDLQAEKFDPETIYTPSADATSAAPMVTLAAAPCLSGFYAAVLDTFQKVLRVVPLGDDGVVSGTAYNVPLKDDLTFMPLPALIVEGGTCDSLPTRLVLSYALEPLGLGADTSEVHVDYLRISRAAGLDTFALEPSLVFDQMGAILPAYFFFPSGAIFIQRSLDLVPYDGRYLLVVATATSPDADRAGLEAIEVDGTSIVGKHKATAVQPAGPRTFHLGVAQGRAWLATGNWTNKDPAGLMRIGCGEAP